MKIRVSAILPAIIALLLVNVTPAQPRTSLEKGLKTDTMMQSTNLSGKKSGCSEMQENAKWSGCKEGMMARMGNQEAYECSDTRQMPMSMGMMHNRLKHFLMIPAFLFLMCMTIMGIINILLTTLVSLDMARANRFNGLWIPILLLVGIPGTALYALFRIGDAIRTQDKTK